jgi:chromosomal replication initiator protein
MTPHVSDIQAAVCQQYHIAPIEMTSRRNGRALARPRQVAMYLTRELTPLSTPEIGKAFARDHTTVLHAIRTIEAIMARDRQFASAIAVLRYRIAYPGQHPLPLDQA